MVAVDRLAFAGHVLAGRWLTVFASFLIMSAAGATYIFAVYSKDIKSALGYDQQTLNTIAFFKDVGANVGILSGLIGEVTPPWFVLSVGAAMNLAGYLMIYLAITGRTPRPHVWQMCLYIAVGANSQTFANTGALVTTVMNFPESRSIVIGLLKGFVGLSGAIFTQLYLAFYGNDSKSLVLLVAWLPAAVSVVFVRTIRIVEIPRQAKEFKAFCSFLYISLVLAGYLMVVIIVQRTVSFTSAGYIVSAVIILLLLFLPLAVVINQELNISKQKKQADQNPEPVSEAIDEGILPLPPPTASTTSNKSSCGLQCIIAALKPPPRGEDYSILQALVSLDMAIIFFATVGGVGGTLTAIDNLGQIGESLGYPPGSIGTFVSLISIWNYAGRVAAGFASEIVLAKYKFPRPLMFSLVLLLSCVGHLLIAFGVPGALYVSSVVLGFCFGAQMPLLFTIISEVFGLKYFSTLYNFGALASPVASYVLNVRVAGYLYDREAAKQNAAASVASAGKSLTCVGVRCFRLGFLIITAVTVAGALALLVLTWRTKDFYRGDIYAKFRDGAKETRKDESPANSGRIIELDQS